MIANRHAENSHNAAALLALLLDAGLIAPAWDTRTVLVFTEAYRAKRNRGLSSTAAVAELLDDQDGGEIPMPLLSEVDAIAY